MPTKTQSTSVPYRYPWRDDMRRAGGPWLVLAGIGLIVLGVVMSLSNLAQDKYLEASTGMIFFGALGVASLGAAIRVAKPRGSVQFINAVVLTEAEAPPTDSWVHLIRFRRATAGPIIVLSAFGLGLAGITAIGVQHVLTTSVDASGYFRLVPAAILGALAALFLTIVLRSLFMGSRTTSVGQRPVGVAVGESGLMLNMLGLDAELPWASIESIEAGTITVGRGRRGEQEIPTIDIRARGKLHCLTLASLSTPPMLAYATLKFYLDNPSLRDELGTTRAQSRFDAWHRALLAS